MLHLKNSHHRLSLSIAGFCLFLLTAPVWADTSYSFPRILEGSATLLTVDGDREEVVEQQPILVGDRLWVPEGTRLELVLADRSLLRIEGDSEVEFATIAYSADTEDRATTLRLRRGKFQLVVPEDALGDSLAQLDTPDATIYVHREGTFRITVEARFTELVVRDGLAELVTDRGSLLLHADEAGWAEGDRDRLEVRRAHYRDGLERWGDRLSDEARLAYSPYLDDSLRYYSASISNHGTWFEIGGRHAWRPRVDPSWSPYSRGYWRRTPVGLTWVSYDSWGYVTDHYGDWDYDEYNGWVWYPGRIYSPARVHWYWGPSYVGWCPSGYYSNYYGRRHGGSGLRVGVYGWAGGSWDPFSHWNFSLTLDFGRHYGRNDHRRYIHSGRDLAQNHQHLDRGIISNDHHVRGSGADEIFAGLREEMDHHQGPGGQANDVNDFVARQPLREQVAQTVLQTSRPSTPLASGTPANTPGQSGAARPGRPTMPEVREEAANGRPTMTEVRGETPRPRPGATRRPSRVTSEDQPATANPTSATAPSGKPLRSVDKPSVQDRPAGRYDGDGREPTAKPTNRVPTTRPTDRVPTTRPTDRTPTARPVDRTPSTTRTPTARPVDRTPATTRTPTARPVDRTPATTRTPTPQPTKPAPVARPTTKAEPKADRSKKDQSKSNDSQASSKSSKKSDSKANSKKDSESRRQPAKKKKDGGG